MTIRRKLFRNPGPVALKEALRWIRRRPARKIALLAALRHFPRLERSLRRFAGRITKPVPYTWHIAPDPQILKDWRDSYGLPTLDQTSAR